MIDPEKILKEAKSGNLKKWVEYILRWRGFGEDCKPFPYTWIGKKGNKLYRSYLKQAYECFHNESDIELKGYILRCLVDIETQNYFDSVYVPEFVKWPRKKAAQIKLLKEGCRLGDLPCIWYAAYNYIRRSHRSSDISEEDKAELTKEYNFYKWEVWSQKTKELINDFESKRVRFKANDLVNNCLLYRKLNVLEDALFSLGGTNYLLWCKIIYRSDDIWDTHSVDKRDFEEIRKIYPVEILKEFPETIPEVAEFYREFYQSVLTTNRRTHP